MRPRGGGRHGLRRLAAAAVAAFGLQAGVAHAGQSHALPPIPWQDQAPVARLFLQPPFEEPELLLPGQASAEVRTAYSNSVLLAANDRFRVDLDGETLRSAIVLRYGLLRRVEATFELPVFLDQGGALDGVIEAVEGAFGALNPVRRQLPRNAATFSIGGTDGRAIVRRGRGAGVGDVVAGAKALVFDQSGWRPAVTLRGLVKAPSGGSTFGSGGTDIGAGLLAGWVWRRAALRLAVDFVRPGNALEDIGIETKPYGAAQVGLAFRATDRLTLHLQTSGHLSPIRGTGLAALEDRTFYLLAGAGYAASKHFSFDVGIVENVFSPDSGADITLLTTLRARF